MVALCFLASFAACYANEPPIQKQAANLTDSEVQLLAKVNTDSSRSIDVLKTYCRYRDHINAYKENYKSLSADEIDKLSRPEVYSLRKSKRESEQLHNCRVLWHKCDSDHIHLDELISRKELKLVDDFLDAQSVLDYYDHGIYLGGQASPPKL
jgi:hypothetical protein